MTVAINLKDTCSLEEKEQRKENDQPRQHTKNRDITLPMKIHLVKATVFPVVMYVCESWTIKKAECQGIDALNGRTGEDS